MFLQTITVLKPAVTTDRYGDEQLSWTAPVRVPVDRVSVQPSIQSEPTEANRNAVVTGWHVITAPGRPLNLSPHDRVELYGGVVCEVVGEVAAWPDVITGKVDHYECDLTRVTG